MPIKKESFSHAA